MAESATIIDGVGDEVLLFGILLCIVAILLCLWLLRRGSRRSEEPDLGQGINLSLLLEMSSLASQTKK